MHARRIKTKNQGITLASYSFTYEDCVFLSKILHEKYGLKTSVIKAGHVNPWKISIWKQSMSDLVSIVKPYIVDEMKYKFIGYLSFDSTNQSPTSTRVYAICN